MNAEKKLLATLPISFWLVPSESCRLELTSLINFLADRYNAPRFVPHVTLLVTQLANDESPLQILESATQGFSPFNLEFLELQHGPDRFKSVFIRLNSEPIEPLFAAIRASCRYPGNYQLDAHLSLLYLQLPVTERISILSALQMPQNPFLFDTVIAVSPGRSQNCFDDIEQWRLIDQVVLTPSLACPPDNGNS